MGQLLVDGGGGPVTRCRHCGKPAAGPCARCRASVCGDCSVLTEGGATTFAICIGCAEHGTGLQRPWLQLLAWLGGLVAIGLVIALALAALRR